MPGKAASGRHGGASGDQVSDRTCTQYKKKPWTYRQNAHKAYLGIVKKKRPRARLLCRGIRQPLQYLRRNLQHIEQLLRYFPEGTQLPLPGWLFCYWVIQHVHE